MTNRLKFPSKTALEDLSKNFGCTFFIDNYLLLFLAFHRVKVTVNLSYISLLITSSHKAIGVIKKWARSVKFPNYKYSAPYINCNLNESNNNNTNNTLIVKLVLKSL